MREYKKITYFENIPVVPNQDKIYMRLGYRNHVTVLTEEHQRMLARGIQKGVSLCRLKGAIGRFDIIARHSDFVRLEDGYVLKSKSLSKLLLQSDEVILLASTAGKEVVERIFAEIDSGDATLGVIMDAVASQAADEALGWMIKYIAAMIKREDKKITKHRYSPGYGDLLLENQAHIFEKLGLQKLDLKLTEKYMLVPEKSVIAIAGIERVKTNE
ncbi:MAG: methionine synthase [Firmicutes bacterium]|nr:methionine synthase [Bacillota bacterium]